MRRAMLVLWLLAAPASTALADGDFSSGRSTALAVIVICGVACVAVLAHALRLRS